MTDASSVIGTLLNVGTTAANAVFAERQRQVELQIQKSRAQAELTAQQTALATAQTNAGMVGKFAKMAFFVMAGLAGLAILAEARKLWGSR